MFASLYSQIHKLLGNNQNELYTYLPQFPGVPLIGLDGCYPAAGVARPGGAADGNKAGARAAALTSNTDGTTDGSGLELWSTALPAFGGGANTLGIPLTGPLAALFPAPFDNVYSSFPVGQALPAPFINANGIGYVGGVYSARVLISPNMSGAVQFALLGEDGTLKILVSGLEVDPVSLIVTGIFAPGVCSVMNSANPGYVAPVYNSAGAQTGSTAPFQVSGARIIFDSRVVFGDGRAFSPCTAWSGAAALAAQNANQSRVFIFESPAGEEIAPVLSVVGTSLSWVYQGGGANNPGGSGFWAGDSLFIGLNKWLVFSQSKYSLTTGNYTGLLEWAVIGSMATGETFAIPTFGLYGGQSFFVVMVDKAGRPVTAPSNIVTVPGGSFVPSNPPHLTVISAGVYKGLLGWNNPLPYFPATWQIWNTSNPAFSGLGVPNAFANATLKGDLQPGGFQLPAMLPITPGGDPEPTSGQSFFVVAVDAGTIYAPPQLLTTPSNNVVAP
jgi:hypothetical protein